MDFLTKVFLTYTFIAFYFMFLFILIYLQNRKKIDYVPPVTKKYSLSVVLTCFNEGKSIGKAIDNLANNGYSNLQKIIVVDDCSRDNSYEIIQEYQKKYPNLVLAVQTPKNTGCAAGAKNYGSQFVTTELIGFSDGDSYPQEGALESTIGFFDDKNVSAVTSTVLVRNRTNLLTQIQSIEYIVIKFTRKLLEFINSIYVTPGPLAIYRREYFEKIGKFDEKNLTEDIEITWRMLYHGYDVRMSVPAKVYSIAPSNFRAWFRQRVRWNKGGIQCIFKYANIIGRRGMLGAFVLPFFVCSWVLGIFGLGFLFYRVIRTIILRYFVTAYSIKSNAALILIKDIELNPSILTYFGLVLLIISISFSLIALFNIKERKEYKRPNLFIFILYEFFYLLMYPIILVKSAWELVRGIKTWN
jgi:cellulose synthase/poly-beta-1,6-N-acetylglucosamine synthase-like glycosyltransferase